MGKSCLLKKCLFCFYMLMASFAVNAVDYPSGSVVAVNGNLKVIGNKMVNEYGRPIQLRGMSSHGLGWFEDCYTEDAIRTLVEDWKITVFRLAVYTHEWGGYTTEEWKTKDEYNHYIDTLVDLCAKYGIYCIIDWHVLNQGSGDPNYTIEDAKPFWKYMSEKHKDAKHVIYEICNEPNGMSVTWEVVKRYADVIIPIIRKNDPNTIIICGTPNWSQDVNEAAKNPLSYDNIMYALHFYSGSHGVDLLSMADSVMIDNELPLFVSEFGTSSANGSEGVFLNECDMWMDWMKVRKISWCNWSFADKSESSAALKPKSCGSEDWNDVSESGEYIKRKLVDTVIVRKISYDDEVFIYPNPVEEELFLQTPKEAVMQGILITDMLGRCVYSIEGMVDKVNLSELNKGLYFVKIMFSDGFTIKRIVKK